jgi:hypothetical protein
MTVNKYVAALVFAIVATLGGIEAGLSSGTLTASVLFTAITAGVGVGLFKLMSPESIVAFPPVVTAVLLAVVVATPVFKEANADGVMTVQEWIGVAVAFVTAVVGKLTVPASMLKVTPRPFRSGY